jgi:pimeloyl-ACP methyl ester carboxylesterase
MHETVSLCSCNIRYLVAGAGPALVCLHPSSGVRITAATELLMHGATVYMPACPGFDGSPRPDTKTCVPQLADWLGEFIDTVIRGPVDLCGHSFGGWVAGWLAVRRPELVRALVLQCPIGIGPIHPAPCSTSTAALLARTYSHPERRRPEEKTQETIAANRAMAAAYRDGLVTDDALLDRLSRLQARTLVLHGRDDGIVPRAAMQLLASTIPNAQLAVIDDAAHNIEVDQPDTYARLVANFLANHA